MDENDFEIHEVAGTDGNGKTYEVGGREYDSYGEALEYKVELLFREIFLRVGKMAEANMDPESAYEILVPKTSIIDTLLDEEYTQTEPDKDSVMGKLSEIETLIAMIKKAKSDLKTNA